MANTRKRATAGFSAGNSLAELIGSVPTNKKGRHIGFREIRFKSGRIEFDYTVNQGKITNEGTMIVRYSSDDELGQLAQQLADQFGKLYQESERG